MRKIISNRSTIIQDSYIPHAHGYDMHSVLGKGGMGTTYLATQISLNRPVVIKVLDTDSDDLSIIKEAIAAINSGKDNPHIVNIIDVVETTDGRVGCVMEYIEGDTLGQFLKNRAEIDVIDIINIARQICYGLNSLHESGLVYLDIKPDNIFLMKSDRVHVKIIDFGTVRKKGQYKVKDKGEIIGTPENCSPEILAGGYVDNRSDIYSLGVLLYYLAAGANPLAEFIKDNPGNEYQKVLAGILQGISLDSVKKSQYSILAPIIEKAMHIDPDKRFQSLNELNEALETVRDEIIINEYNGDESVQDKAQEEISFLGRLKNNRITNELLKRRQELKAKLKEVQDDLAKKEKQISILNQTKIDQDSHLKYYENELKSADELIASLNGQISELTGKLNSEKEELETLKQQIAKHDQQIETFSMTLTSFKKERDCYKLAFEKSKEESDSLKKRILELETALNAKESGINPSTNLQNGLLEKPQVIDPGKASGRTYQIRKDH